jgi:hypothetical protein
MLRTALFVSTVILPLLTNGHHSSAGLFDHDNMVEIEGVITSVRWRNPHPEYTAAVADENGETVEWRIETGSVSTLRLRGVDRDFIQVGDRVRLAGGSSLRGLPEMFAENMLLNDGREVLLRAVSKPFWPAGITGNLYQRETDEELASQGRQGANGIFRAWTPIFNDPEGYPLLSAGDYPLTEQANALKAQWDPNSSPYNTCNPKPMPYIMGSAYPIAIEPMGEDILIKIEEFDLERLVHMDALPPPNSNTHTHLGYSNGRWDGDALVIETQKVQAGHLYGDGTPTSRAIHLLERFELNEDQGRLYYTLSVTDTESFTENLEFKRYWVWQPDVRVEPYECNNEL